jgi:hypothetical protein
MNLKESKPPTVTSIDPEEEEKNTDNKEFDIKPQEHTEKQIKERNIFKAKRIVTNDDDEPANPKPKKVNKKATRRKRRS